MRYPSKFFCENRCYRRSRVTAIRYVPLTVLLQFGNTVAEKRFDEFPPGLVEYRDDPVATPVVQFDCRVIPAFDTTEA